MTQRRYVYLDYAASAPLRPEAVSAREEYLGTAWGSAGANPNSLHTLGRSASLALASARSDIAAALGGSFRPSDVVFTSGGTESNNLALFGMAEGARDRDRNRTKVLISAIEHDSVLDVVAPLRDRGFEVVLVGPDAGGVITPAAVERALDGHTALVSVMSANNETGVIQPVADIAALAHRAGALMHTDAVQAFCRIPLELSSVDAVSVAAHKIGGPVGVGALAVRGRSPLRPQSFGGGQESGRRAGTQDVCGAVAFAAVATALRPDIDGRRRAVASRAQGLYERLCSSESGIEPTTTAMVDDRRLPGIVSVVVPGIESESLILRLDDVGFEVSAGSACSSGSLDPSHVLTAMGMPRDKALGSLRISFDDRVSERDLESFGDALADIVRAFRSSNPRHATRAHDSHTKES